MFLKKWILQFRLFGVTLSCDDFAVCSQLLDASLSDAGSARKSGPFHFYCPHRSQGSIVFSWLFSLLHDILWTAALRLIKFCVNVCLGPCQSVQDIGSNWIGFRSRTRFSDFSPLRDRTAKIVNMITGKVMGGCAWNCQGKLDFAQLRPDRFWYPGQDWRILYHCQIGQNWHFVWYSYRLQKYMWISIKYSGQMGNGQSAPWT